MKRPEKTHPKPYQIDFEKRKREGILYCPGDPEYDTVAVLGDKTQKECDAITLEIRNAKDKGPLTDEELVRRGAVDVTEEGVGVMLPLSSTGGKKKKRELPNNRNPEFWRDE